MVAITAENNQVVLEDDACVTVSSGWTLALHVEDLRVGWATHHRRSFSETHGAAQCFPLAHLLIVLVEVGGVMILDQVRPLHLVRCRRVEPDSSLILETLSFLEQSQGIHGSHTSLSRSLSLLCRRVHTLECATFLCDRPLVLHG